MPSIRLVSITLSAALLCACQSAPTRRTSTSSIAQAAAPAWRGVALLADPAQAPRDATLEVVLVSLTDARPLAHAEFAVKTAARIEFALPADAARDAESTPLGWRIWLRDASGRMRYASERLVAANRDGETPVVLTRVMPR